jgi:hypothetical protein
MSAERIEQVVAAIANAVEDAELTVDELTDAIAARVGDRVMEACQDKWPRWRQAESIATDRGVMCFGPDCGRRDTYTSPRRWLPGFWPAPVEKGDTSTRTGRRRTGRPGCSRRGRPDRADS